jgi:hypothetical protein
VSPRDGGNVFNACDLTIARVTKGAVAVRDEVERTTLVLRAGKKYLAKPRR